MALSRIRLSHAASAGRCFYFRIAPRAGLRRLSAFGVMTNAAPSCRARYEEFMMADAVTKKITTPGTRSSGITITGLSRSR